MHLVYLTDFLKINMASHTTAAPNLWFVVPFDSFQNFVLVIMLKLNLKKNY